MVQGVVRDVSIGCGGLIVDVPGWLSGGLGVCLESIPDASRCGATKLGHADLP